MKTKSKLPVKTGSLDRVVTDEFSVALDVKFIFTPDPSKCSGNQSSGSRCTLDPFKVSRVNKVKDGGCVIFLGKGNFSKRYAKESKETILKRIASTKSLRSELIAQI